MTCALNTIETTRAGVCLLLSCMVGILSVSRAVAQDAKRGVGGSEIAQANALNGRWYYNWSNNPPADVLNGSLHGEYVPMIWSASAGTIQARVDNILGYASSLGVDHVLGFNEPDRAEQANMSVATAISLWDAMDDQFANAGIKLVSPALGDDAGGRAWLDDFMNQANALNLQVDAVAMHWYGNVNISNPTATANSFLSRVDFWHNTYGKPIWITEFAGMDWGVDDISSEDLKAFNEAFLAVVVPGLESRSYVERYAWWQFGRRDVPGEENDTQLIEQVGGLWTPTGIGDQYVPSYREGEQHNLSGTNPGKTNFYLRGGSLINGSGASVTVASVDAVDGNSDFGGAADWRIENGVFRVRNSAVIRKIGSSKVTVSGVTISNAGEIQLVGGALALEKGAQLAGLGSVDLASGATLSLGAAIDRIGAVISQPVELDGGVIQANQISDGVHTISSALMVRLTSTFSGNGTVIVSGPIQSPASGAAGGILKEGAGTVVLTGGSSFRGNIDVKGGKLEMTAGATMAAASGFAVGSGARLNVSGLPAGLPLASGQTLANKAGGTVEGNVVVGIGAEVSAAGVFDGNVVAQSGGTISVGGQSSATATPQTIRITPPNGATGGASDVRVRSGSNANSNQGDAAALGIGSINATDAFRSLLTFDLSSTGITDPSYINSVGLTMTLHAPNGAQVDAPSAPTLELLTIGAYNSDTATFNNTTFNAANLISTTTGPNFTQYAAGATIGWSQSTSGTFVDAVKNALGGSLHLGARAASLPGTRSFYFIDQAETATAGAAPSLAITYTVPTSTVGSAIVDGDMTLASGSTLEVDLFDASSYDQLDVNGVASLSGILSVDAIDLSRLALNDTFTILTANSVVNNLTLGGLDGNLFNLSASTATSLVLTYVGVVALPADFDGNMVVDGDDLAIWKTNFGLATGATKALGDANADGAVNGADYLQWQRELGQGTPPSAALASAVPEPDAAALVVLALIAASRRRRPPVRRFLRPASRATAGSQQTIPTVLLMNDASPSLKTHPSTLSHS